ncbi:hypothetical protein [Altererythrobacter sp. ZODW24]|uniref:hypothetical protein n=1 Tax=Altererythrobacter sp. ZODW24 TaxID=2185142 RepID=UPI000DF77E9D|nr:hypothetical protein [Altererythrobacter sp. ZODW24]
MNDTISVKTPWHLWVVGVVTFLFNAVGALDYTMSQLRNRSYLSAAEGTYNITVDEMIAYIDAFPAWANATWALGVWGAFFGSLLLLFRSRYAVWSFAVSIVGLVLTTIYQFNGNMPEALEGPGQVAFAAVIWAITIGLFLYARRMTAKGVLR